MGDDFYYITTKKIEAQETQETQKNNTIFHQFNKGAVPYHLYTNSSPHIILLENNKCFKAVGFIQNSDNKINFNKSDLSNAILQINNNMI